MSWFSQICLSCVSEGIPRRSFIVGTILNLVNQGDAVLAGGHVDLAKVILTYAVPYCVATYGAVSVRATAIRKGASMSAKETDRAAS